MTLTVSRRWAAMATAWEVYLVGDDAEHLEAVASALEDECRRLESTLSRFDPASEISRLNRAPPGRPVRLGVELYALLAACDDYRRRTGGSFDVGGGLEFDPTTRTVRRAAGGVDLGGIGKGYALDRMAELLRDNAIGRALLIAGTSSLLAVGPWPVDVGEVITLTDQGLSYSAARHPGQQVSDIVDPLRSTPIEGDAACVVLAPTAAEAEALSTALLAMGRARAICYSGGVRAAWIESGRIDWLNT